MPDSRDTNELIEEFAQNPGTESETLDFKSKEVLEATNQKRDLVQLLAEMANNRGGSVIIGVRIEDRDLRLQGFDVDSEYKQEIAHIIHAYASAHLTELCEFSFETHSGKRLLRIDVEQAQEDLVKVEIEGEDQIRVRDLDGGREMSSGEIKSFYEQVQQRRVGSGIPEIRDSKTVEARCSEDLTTVLEPFNGHPTIQLDSDGFTPIFVNGFSFPVISHTHTYRLGSSLPVDTTYEDCLDLLQAVSEKMGGNLRHGFGYSFRWGDTQVVGRTIDALKSDLERYEDLASHLADTGETTSIYDPILAGAVRCDYGLFWFELQRESDTFVRGEFQLIAPDIPVDSSGIEDVFSSCGSVPRAYEQQAGVQILRINTTSSNDLQQPIPRSVGETDNFDITNVVCDNPVFRSLNEESGQTESTPSKRIEDRLSKIHRLPFDIAGGYVADDSDQLVPRSIDAMLVGATFPTLILEPRADQRVTEESPLDSVILPEETSTET